MIVKRKVFSSLILLLYLFFPANGTCSGIAELDEEGWRLRNNLVLRFRILTGTSAHYDFKPVHQEMALLEQVGSQVSCSKGRNIALIKFSLLAEISGQSLVLPGMISLQRSDGRNLLFLSGSSGQCCREYTFLISD